MSRFVVGELVRIRAMSSHPIGWREPKTGIVMGPAAEDPWEFHDDRLPPRYVPVLVDGTVVQVNEMKIQYVEQS